MGRVRGIFLIPEESHIYSSFPQQRKARPFGVVPLKTTLYYINVGFLRDTFDFLEGSTAHQVAARFGYTYRAFTSLVALFRIKLSEGMTSNMFFVETHPGRKVSHQTLDIKSIIIGMRKKYYSVPDIKVALDASGHFISEKNIYNVLYSEGFARLHRRTKLVRQQLVGQTRQSPQQYAGRSGS